MRSITVMGFDPSLRNFGMVKGLLNIDTGKFDLKELCLSEAPTSAQKKQVRQNSKDLDDAKKHVAALIEFTKDVDLIMVEIPVGSQSARAMASYGICIGIISAIQLPLIQVTPAEVKMVTGHKNATKAQMIDWAVTNYPHDQWLTQKRNGVVSYIGKNEHLADALAAVHAGIDTDQFQQAKSLMK